MKLIPEIEPKHQNLETPSPSKFIRPERSFLDDYSDAEINDLYSNLAQAPSKESSGSFENISPTRKKELVFSPVAAEARTRNLYDRVEQGTLGSGQLFSEDYKPTFKLGSDWYGDVHSLAHRVSEGYGGKIHPKQFLGIVAALSPQNPWVSNDGVNNLEDALKLTHMYVRHPEHFHDFINKYQQASQLGPEASQAKKVLVGTFLHGLTTGGLGMHRGASEIVSKQFNPASVGAAERGRVRFRSHGNGLVKAIHILADHPPKGEQFGQLTDYDKKILTILNGHKTANFFDNLVRAGNSGNITSDVWMQKLGANRQVSDPEKGQFQNVVDYLASTVPIAKLAREKGIPGAKMQAGLWTVLRHFITNQSPQYDTQVASDIMNRWSGLWGKPVRTYHLKKAIEFWSTVVFKNKN